MNSHSIRKTNFYDWAIVFTIALNAAGAFMAPLTLIRLLSILLIPYVLNKMFIPKYRLPKFVYLFFIIWFVHSVASLLWTPDKINGVKYLCYNLSSYICFYSLYIFSKKANSPICSIILGWCVLFVITVPFALNEFINDVHLSVSVHDDSITIIDASSGHRVFRKYASVTFGNLNNYSLTIIYCLPFALLGLLINNKHRALKIVIVAVMASILLFNASRGGLLCLVLSVILFLIYLFRNNQVKRWSLFALLFIVIAVIYHYSDIILSQIAGRMLESSLTDDTARIRIIENALTVLSNSLGMGSGIGGLELSLKYISSSDISATHNLFLELLCQYGIISFTIFIALLWKIFRTLTKSNENAKNFLGYVIAIIILPLSVINSGYLTAQIFWLFISSLLCIGLLEPGAVAKHH